MQEIHFGQEILKKFLLSVFLKYINFNAIPIIIVIVDFSKLAYLKKLLLVL